ncbi:MAG: acyltransferase [Deltaproteobacteria bacterium]|nr:acyltransferase [Deltaproteobacteria bacterium]
MAYYTRSELADLGFASFGDDVRVSDRASLYNCAGIRLGNHVRIDDFCVLSAGEGGIVIGDYVHIAVGSLLIGKARIVMDDFAGLSARVCVYSSSDDYSGRTLTNPTVPAAYAGVRHGDVRLGKHVIVGTGSVILPGVEIGDGSAVGALSLVTTSCAGFGIFAGSPARLLKERDRGLLELEAKLRASGA